MDGSTICHSVFGACAKYGTPPSRTAVSPGYEAMVIGAAVALAASVNPLQRIACHSIEGRGAAGNATQSRILHWFEFRRFPRYSR